MPPWTPTLNESALVALGGGCGAFLRLGLGRALLAAGVATPWPTALINLAGSFALGVLAAACRDRPGLLVLLGTGVCGGFTTFSAFGVELARLLGEARPGAAAAYALASVAGAAAGAALGARVAGGLGGG